ncbi:MULTISPECIES: alpha/beta hydrolase [unclassified Fusibacter]|uniref:alpha/beta hydrolase n=1 Tax=unclassified Fusibacter TaxID=2624464 RepID=UPI0010101C5E|nr:MULTISPECIES: alpha/beta hydrolase [unclassified Fusibacter]MCK8060637.1 alpha/beta hydrolase [Fusibacter sp. A2]NPE22909.1 alpha/beta hydrolase [Fusibacter sp. A1]RXV59977.1 alpha/beta hydrolase [Fusibacter sp. A1]
MSKGKISIRGKIAHRMITKITSSRLFGKKVRRGEHLTKVDEPQWKCPRGYECEIIVREKFILEFIKNYRHNQKRVVLQLHGGGYIGRLRNVHRNMAKLYSEYGNGIGVLTPDYRVAPDDPYPAALEDALDSYEWLLQNGYSENQIIVAGDSAGGGLAMALCLYLKTQARKLPCAIIAMSPWTDMTASGKSYDFNFERDPLFGNTRDSVLYNRDYLGDENEEKPYVSPMFGDFYGFPPMLIQAGSYEMLLSDSINVAKKAKESGVSVKLHIYEGMFHDFQMAMEFLPEAKMAWTEVGEFIDSLVE